MVRAGGFPCVGSAVQVILALELHEQRFLPYIEKVQLLLLRVYWLLLLLLMMQMPTSVPAAIAAADTSRELDDTRRADIPLQYS